MSYQLQKKFTIFEREILLNHRFTPSSPQIFILCLCRRRMGRVLGYISLGNHGAFWGRLRHRIHGNLPPSDLPLTGFNEVIGSASACKTSLWMHSAVALRKSHLQSQLRLYKLSLCMLAPLRLRRSGSLIVHYWRGRMDSLSDWPPASWIWRKQKWVDTFVPIRPFSGLGYDQLTLDNALF